jgi:hypothetical protein
VIGFLGVSSIVAPEEVQLLHEKTLFPFMAVAGMPKVMSFGDQQS